MKKEEQPPPIRGQYNKVIGFQIPISKRCDTHRKEKMGYLEWHAESLKKHRLGQKQSQCPTCGHWYWPDEM